MSEDVWSDPIPLGDGEFVRVAKRSAGPVNRGDVWLVAPPSPDPYTMRSIAEILGEVER